MQPTIGCAMNVYQQSQIVWTLIVRNLTVKYKRSLLGFLWTLLNPFLTVVVLGLVFSYVVRIPLEHYWAFLISGYFVWNYIQLTLNISTQVISDHGQLCRSIAFPSELLVIAAVGSRFVEFIFELIPVVIVLVVLHHGRIPPSLMMIVPLLIMLCMVVMGLAFPVATISVYHSDIQHAMPVALTIIFYLSPVFYPASMVPEALAPYYSMNPIAHLLMLFHRILYEARFPEWTDLATWFAVSATLLVIGYRIYTRNKRVFPEIV